MGAVMFWGRREAFRIYRGSRSVDARNPEFTAVKPPELMAVKPPDVGCGVIVGASAIIVSRSFSCFGPFKLC